MKKFESIFNKLLSENMVSGGPNSVWGNVNVGEFGNQFPSQNDKAYNPNDSRPFDPAKMILGAKKVGKKTKKTKVKFPIQRRAFPLA